MQEYDVALKLLLRGSAQLTIRELTAASVETWIDTGLPKIQNLRVDLLAETAEGGWSIWSCRVQTTLPWHCEWRSTH